MESPLLAPRVRVGLAGRAARRRLAGPLADEGYEVRVVDLAALLRGAERADDPGLDVLIVDLTRDTDRRQRQLTRLRALGLGLPILALLEGGALARRREILTTLDVRSELIDAAQEALVDRVFELAPPPWEGVDATAA